MGAYRRYSARVISYYGASTSANAILLAFYLKRFHHTVVGRVCLDVPRTFFVRGNTSYFAYVAVLWARLSAPVAVVASLREPSVLFAVVLGVLVLKEKMTTFKIATILTIFLGDFHPHDLIVSQMIPQQVVKGVDRFV